MSRTIAAAVLAGLLLGACGQADDGGAAERPQATAAAASQPPAAAQEATAEPPTAEPPTAEPPTAEPAPTAAPTSPPTAPALPTAPAATAPAVTPEAPRLPERVPAGPPLVVGDVPADLLARIVGDLAALVGADPQTIGVVRGEAVTWSDGSLGCPRPGMAYTQVPVAGYWVVLESGGAEYDYRATGRGGFVRCERQPRVAPGGLPGGALPPGTGDPTR